MLLHIHVNTSVVTMNMQSKAQQTHCVMVPFLTMACVCASWAEEKVPGLVGNKNISVVTMNMQRKAQQMHCIMVPFLTMAEEEVSTCI